MRSRLEKILTGGVKNISSAGWNELSALVKLKSLLTHCLSFINLMLPEVTVTA
jgi:hypothetical protein